MPYEVDFDIQWLPPINDQVSSAIIHVASIVDGSFDVIVIVQARVTFQGFEETIAQNGKTFRKQEAIFTDNTASVRIVFGKVTSRKFNQGHIRFQGQL